MRWLILILLLAFFYGTVDATERSKSAKAAFVRMYPCPMPGVHRGTSCPGHVIDHIDALACGGADAPRNMQWQTIAAAKAKDKWERKGCRNGRRI